MFFSFFVLFPSVFCYLYQSSCNGNIVATETYVHCKTLGTPTNLPSPCTLKTLGYLSFILRSTCKLLLQFNIIHKLFLSTWDLHQMHHVVQLSVWNCCVRQFLCFHSNHVLLGIYTPTFSEPVAFCISFAITLLSSSCSVPRLAHHCAIRVYLKVQ